MGEVLVLDVGVFAVECSEKALLRTVVVAGNKDVCQYFAVYICIAVKFVECIYENIVALVGVFVASRSCDNQRVFLEFARSELFCHSNHFLACLAANFGCFFCLRNEVVLESVWSYHIGRFGEQLCALRLCNVANCCENISIDCAYLLKAVLRYYVELAGHILAVVVCKVLVQRQSVSCNGTAYCCCVGSESRCDVRSVLLQVEDTCSGHPLVELGEDSVVCREVEVAETFDDLAGGVSEQGWFYVVPLTRQRVELVVFPEVGENLVLFADEIGETDEYYLWASADVPASGTHAQTSRCSILLPFSEESRLLDELGVFVCSVCVGADEDEVAAAFRQCQ